MITHSVCRLTSSLRCSAFFCYADFSFALALSSTSKALPSETPAHFKPVTDSFDHERREVKIPMRDGVKLHTVILIT